MNDAEPDGAPGMLNGWKEIAAYLGKSVRSVQRWERDLGLPVRRINTPDRGQIIYASRSEIEQWRRRMDTKAVSLEEEPGRSSEDGGTTTPLSVPTVEVAPDLSPAPQSDVIPRRRSLRAVQILAIALAAIAAGVLLGRWTMRRDPVPARAELASTALLAMTSSGETLWRHEFGEPVRRPDGPHGSPQFVDLDRDGETEIIVPVRFETSIKGPARSDEVICFRHDGSIVWRATPKPSLTQGDRTFSGPWTFRRLASPGDSAGGRSWVAFSHRARSPGVLLEIDPGGAARVRFVQDGWIASLAYWPTPRGGVLAIGGVHDVEERASVALVLVDGLPTQAPTRPDRRLRCASCPIDPPAAYFLLPPSEVAIAGGRVFSEVIGLSVTHAGLRVATDDHQVGVIGPSLQFQLLDYTDEHWAAHRLLEEHHKLDHPAEKCRQRWTPREVQSWQPDIGWTVQRVPSEPMRTGGCP
jgi:hypothetical protein